MNHEHICIMLMNDPFGNMIMKIFACSGSIVSMDMNILKGPSKTPGVQTQSQNSEVNLRALNRPWSVCLQFMLQALQEILQLKVSSVLIMSAEHKANENDNDDEAVHGNEQDDEEEDAAPTRRRRVYHRICAMCAKEPALRGETDEEDEG